jgi:hypothetical protein
MESGSGEFASLATGSAHRWSRVDAGQHTTESLRQRAPHISGSADGAASRSLNGNTQRRMYWRLVEMAIGAMSDRDFEDLVYALVRAEDDRARQLGPPDAGRDTVVPLDDGTELVWQAKHHTSGIDWGKCEESLTRALEQRQPREINFVFPVKMTAGKESGLGDLRERYDQVTINEPWTLPLLREKLREHDEIRRELIDRRIGIDELYARHLLERAAEREEESRARVSAAMLGPLVATGHDAAFAEAHQAAQAGDLAGASQQFEALADALVGASPAIANAILLEGARCAAENEDRQRAGELYLRASRSAAERGDDLAEYAGFRASWLLDEEERWRSFAAMARGAWPERPDESLPALRSAFDRSLNAHTDADILEWSLALCDALAAHDEWPELVDVAQKAVDALGPVRDGGKRLELELELLSGCAELGEEVDDRWRQLTLAPVGRSGESAALIRARWGMSLARRGIGAAAAERFVDAAERWRAIGDREDELAEAIFSEDVVAQALNEGRRLDQAGRIAVAELRGRTATPATVADRIVTQGLRAWLAERGWDARRHLIAAWSIHRRAGHLAGTLRVAETVHDLFKAGEEWADALPWAVRSGLQLAAERAAKAAGWNPVTTLVPPSAPPWERAALFEAIAAAGAEASDTEIAGLVGWLLSGAEDHETDERMRVQAPQAARRALATVLCGVPPEYLAQAVDEVVFETVNTPFPPRRTIEGLIWATDAGVADQADLIAEIFSYVDRAHLTAFGLAVDLVSRSSTATARAVELAERQFPGLLLCAWAGFPDQHTVVAERARDVVQRSIEGTLEGHEILRPDDKGRLARWASPELQAIVARDLLDTLLSPADLGAHRFEAGVGLTSVAERLDPSVARELLDRLIERQDLVSVASTDDGLRSHPNPLFARMRMDAPPAVDEVRAVAHEAGLTLAGKAGRIEQQAQMLEAALDDASGPVRAQAVERAASLIDRDLRPYVVDEDPFVRARALAGLDERDEVEGDDPALIAASQPDEPLMLRSTAARIARRASERHPETLATLRADRHVYLRACARNAGASP